MDINLENIYNPCVRCYIRSNLFSLDNDICKMCEYNIFVELLKNILYCSDGCSLCKNREKLGGGYYGCKIERQEICKGRDMIIDLKAAINDYCN